MPTSEQTPRFLSETAHLDIDQVIRLLSLDLGPTLAAATAGAESVTQAAAWTNGQAAPTPEQAERLRLAYWLFNALQAAESTDIARAFFIGRNARLNNEAPCQFLKRSKAREAAPTLESAARAVIEDQFD